jgi:hypothetical protein
MKISVVVAVLTLLYSAGTPASQQPYRDWMSERAEISGALSNPPDAATALLFLQHLCGSDRTCFPDARWRALDQTARSSEDPVILAIAANVASYRNEHENLIVRWTQVEKRDRGNAYPLLLDAAALWEAGERDRALVALEHAGQSPRFDDYLAGITGFVLRRTRARPPTIEQVHPCALIGDGDKRAAATEPVRITAEVFDIGIDGGIPARVGDLIGLCKQEPVLDQRRADLCISVGKVMADRAPSQLMRSFGFALQRFGTSDPALHAALLERQRSANDELYRKLWWVESSDSDVRDAANTLWMQNFASLGELRAAQSLLERFGDPPYEDPDALHARVDRVMKLAQECYARDRHDH